MISDTFIYDPEEALFYSVGLPREVGSRMLPEGNMTSLADATASRNQSPFELNKSYNKSPLLCFTTEDELEENWQRLHPSFWSNGDVLDVIFYVASKSSHGPDAVHNLRGEKFQNLSGSDLYRMSRQDFRDRDSVYGDLLFDCIQELLSKSEFYPPAGISPTNFELNNVDIFADKDCMTPGVVDDSCDLKPQRSASIPIPVQEIMDAEGLLPVMDRLSEGSIAIV